jgi:hypothetical protein
MKIWIKDKLYDFREDVKQAWKSWTIWFNGLLASGASLLLSLPIDSVISYMPQFQPYLEDALFRNIMVGLIAVNGVNVLLRFKTTKRLSDK